MTELTQKFYGIAATAAEEMAAAMDAAAASYWMYPDILWQLQFEEQWLLERGFAAAAAKAAETLEYEQQRS